MRIGKVGHRLRAFGVAVAALAAVLLAGHPAAAEAGRSVVNTLGVEGAVGTQTVLADRSCTVTNLWSCKITTPIWFNSNSSVNLATEGIPASSDYTTIEAVPTATPDSPYIFPPYYWSGDHNWWDNSWEAGNYVFELKCPYSCQGAWLYITRY